MNGRWDTLIKNATIFDGHQAAPWVGDIAICGDSIAQMGTSLDESEAIRTIDATGRWVMPGLLDIHTHYDLELELAPGLKESVRHGTTTVVISNCSLGLAFGAQRDPERSVDPIVDCFARVENVPKHVLGMVADRATWTDSQEYLDHLDGLNLGPNVVPMIPHSMLRIEVMGFDDSIRRTPRAEELAQMNHLLHKGLAEGYVGFSTDALPFHYLANHPHRHRKIPTQYASFKEIKTLTDTVREFDGVWQATPPKNNPLATIRLLLLTSGRLFGRPLRTTVVAALDVVTNRFLVVLALVLSHILNSWLLKGRFALQALPARFKTWADGAITPIAEEITELRELNEPDLEDRAARRAILQNPEFIRRFEAMWAHGKHGISVARLRRWLRLEDYAFSRSLSDMKVERCPVDSWTGLTLAEVYDRLRALQDAEGVDGLASPVDAQERAVLAELARPLTSEVEFLLHLLRVFDTDLCWSVASANVDPERVRALTMHPLLLPGFSDSGAHLTNMAFYDVNLRALKMAQQGSEADVAYMVGRLTREPAEFFNIDAGVLAVGRRADLTMIDPKALAHYDGEANVRRVYRPEFAHHQRVNRSDGVVQMVFIAGAVVWDGGHFCDGLGRTRFGRRLGPLRSPSAIWPRDVSSVPPAAPHSPQNP